MSSHDDWWLKQGKFPPGSYAKYVEEEAKAVGNQTSSRKQRQEIGVSDQVLPFTDRDYNAVYFQVRVGQFGVKLPDVINMETLAGITLIKDRATRIDDKGFAERIARETGGELMVVTEDFVRRVMPASRMPNQKASVNGEEPHDIRRGLDL